jgi:cobalt-zinc-cadmium efflux system outer membrane protein
MNIIIPVARCTLLLCVGQLLSACNSLPPENSIAQVAQQLGEHYPKVELTGAAPTIANSTLTVESAVQIMLAKSPQVRMELAQMGIANAQQLQAELISNPHLSLGALRPEDGGRWKLDIGLSQPLLELFTRPLRRQIAQENILTVQLRLQAQLQKLIAQTGDAYYSAVAAQQHLQVQRQMLDATLARQQLANSLYRAGNMSENSFLYYDNEARRVQQQTKKRERRAQEKQLELLNIMGLESSQSISLPLHLPILPSETFTHANLLTQARVDRLDLHITHQQLDQLQKRRTFIRQENGWRDMSIGVNAEREFDGKTNVGPEIELALPLFNRNQGKLAALDAQSEKLTAQLKQLNLDADIEIAQTLNQMQSAREQLDLIQASLRVADKRVVLSNREVNFMLGSPFELLNIKRQQIQLAHEYTNELANYWQARTRLELAIGRAINNPASEHEEHQHD